MIEKGVLVNCLETLFISSFATSSAKFNEFNGRNLILFKIKVFGRNIKETTLARQVTTRHSFTQLRVNRQINRLH